MGRNPFNELYEIMGQSTVVDPSHYLAKVSSIGPLEINFMDMTLDKDDFLISYGLQEVLEIGDSILLIKVNDKFIIINKVVAI